MQENIGPGTYTVLLHQEHWCGCMMGSSVVIMNWRPGGRPHCRHLSGRDSLRSQPRTLFNSDGIKWSSCFLPKHLACQRRGRREPLRYRKLRDEFGVSRRKLECPQVARHYPAQISDIERLHLAFDDRAIEKMEAYGFGGIVVIDREELVVDSNLDTKFFRDFPFKRACERFAGLNLATWKFPKPGQVDMARPLRN